MSTQAVSTSSPPSLLNSLQPNFWALHLSRSSTPHPDLLVVPASDHGFLFEVLLSRSPPLVFPSPQTSGLWLLSCRVSACWGSPGLRRTPYWALFSSLFTLFATTYLLLGVSGHLKRDMYTFGLFLLITCFSFTSSHLSTWLHHLPWGSSQKTGSQPYSLCDNYALFPIKHKVLLVLILKSIYFPSSSTTS